MKTNYRLLLIVLLTISGSAYADLYKWVDEQGRVHYGDKPKSMNNAEQMKLQKQKKTSSQPAKTAKSKTAYSSETSRQTEQAYHSDEMKRLSNLPPGEFQQQLQEMEKKRRQAILNTEHEAAVDYEQRQQSWKEKQEREAAEIERREKQRELARKQQERELAKRRDKRDISSLPKDNAPRRQVIRDSEGKVTRIIDPEVEAWHKAQKRQERSWKKMQKLHKQYQ